jgi:RNA polymerase sigma-70 factor, ECF subfamily
VHTMVATTEPPWEELHQNLSGFIGRRVRNPADVEDLVQRVLLQIHRGLGSLRDSRRLHAWVYRTARNTIVDYYRSPAHQREAPAGDAQDLEDRTGADVLFAHTDDGALAELANCLTPLLRQLPAPYLEALTLTDLNGVNQADAARRTGVSVSGMKSRVQRGRKQLKAILEACCRIDLDRRGGVMGFEARGRDACACGPCADDDAVPQTGARPSGRHTPTRLP